MAQPYDICIRGAGIVGRTLALLLARERLRVALVTPPAPPPGHSDVRAYALNTASRTLLDSLRCWPEADAATPVLRMEVHGDDGGLVAFSAEEQGVPALNWIVDVPALESRLADAVRFQPLIELCERPQAAPLTVVCEGRASATRAELGVAFDVSPYPQHAIATRIRCAQPHGGTARQWFSGGEILAFLPLGGAQGNSAAVVWSVPADAVAARLGLDDAAFAGRLEAASHQAPGSITVTAERRAWPLQLARATRWVGHSGAGSWALAGDAAHAMHPLAGQGLNVGLGDAAELARVLQGREYWRSVGDLKLLRRYERARQADVLAMGATTDGLQQLFWREGEAWRALRNWGMTGFDRSGPLKAWVTRRAMGL
jgi:2-polyprenyl-6-methoxyphenol hydroxylase-like FAD-dependent oxidoreductase